MERDIDYEREEETFNDTSREAHVPRKPHKVGRSSKRNLSVSQSCLLVLLLYLVLDSWYEFSEMVERVKFHHELGWLFVTHLHNGQVNLSSVSHLKSNGHP